MYAAFLEKLYVMHRTLRFGNANNLAGRAVDDNLVFYCVAFLFAGIGFPLFF